MRRITMSNEERFKYIPVFRYTYGGGEYYTRFGGSTTEEYLIGEDLTIKVDPNDPKKILLPTDFTTYVPMIATGAAAVALILAGILTFKKNKDVLE